MPSKTASVIIIASCIALVLASPLFVKQTSQSDTGTEDPIQNALNDTLVLDHSEIKADSSMILKDDTSHLTIGAGGCAIIDSTGKTRDSVRGHQWYLCDYKTVPAQGLFVDTTFMDDHNTQFLDIRIIVNRKLLAGFGFTRPSEDSLWWWFTDIDKKALMATYPTPYRPRISPSAVDIQLDHSNGNNISIK